MRTQGTRGFSTRIAKEAFETIVLNFYFLQLPQNMCDDFGIFQFDYIYGLVTLFESCVNIALLFANSFCYWNKDPCQKMECIFCLIFQSVLIIVKRCGERCLIEGMPKRLIDFKDQLPNKHCTLCNIKTKPDVGFAVVQGCCHIFCTHCYALWRIGDGFRS